MDLLTFLHFTRESIYWYEYLFLILLASLTSFVELPFYDDLIEALKTLLNVIIFISGYYGAIISLSMLGLDGIAAGFLFLLFDMIFTSFGSTSIDTGKMCNPYKQISPSEQGSIIASLAFSVLLIYLGSILLEKSGGEE
ncbi:MAG: hypothetical protein ACPL3B_04335 [Fervidobacterium sp.]